ncbi:MAG TPA: hypothetical protein VEC12_13220, partial [Bacteroidia bacterium]|nr:hypothetical protein [Bacteroidia bacterium]
MKTILLLVIALGCSGLYSCQRGYYAPNAQNVPLFQQGGEARFMGSKSDEGDNTFDLQAAWSPVKYIGITGNYFKTVYDPRAHGHYYDFGAGGYFPFKNIVAELYGGIGQGYAYNNFELNRYIKNHLYKYFIQVNLGFTTKYIDIAYSGRFAKLQLYGISWWQTSDNTSNQFTPELVKDLEMLENNKTTLIYEPALTVRAG